MLEAAAGSFLRPNIGFLGYGFDLCVWLRGEGLMGLVIACLRAYMHLPTDLLGARISAETVSVAGARDRRGCAAHRACQRTHGYHSRLLTHRRYPSSRGASQVNTSQCRRCAANHKRNHRPFNRACASYHIPSIRHARRKERGEEMRRQARRRRCKVG